MKVFITGATGYVGSSVAAALRRAGHEVWGLVRTREKAALAARNEVRPVIGTLQDPASFTAAAEACNVVIHAAVDYQADTAALDFKTVDALLAACRLGPQPKTLIYTSGVWVYGYTGPHLVDETMPLNAPKAVGHRPAIEERVLKAAGLRGLVIRPGCVYGRQGGLTGMWFAAAHRDKAPTAIGDGESRWAMVHADDLAEGYRLAAESDLAGEAFNLVDRSRATVLEMVTAAARAAECRAPVKCVPVAEAAKTLGPLAECLALDQHVDARKGMRLLNWRPTHLGFLDEADTYFASWLAAQP